MQKQKKFFISSLLISFIFASPQASYANPLQLRPGSPAVDASSIQEHTAQYSIRLVTAEGEERELQTIERTVERTDGRLVIQWRTEVQGMEVVDRVEVNPTTLALLQTSSPTAHGGGFALRKVSAAQGGLKAIITSMDGQPLEELAPQVTLPIFPGALAPVLLLALPLEEESHFQWQVPALNLEGEGTVEATATGLEEVTVGSEKMPALRVTITNELGTSVVWIAEKAPFIVRKEIQGPQGTLLWVPIP